MVTRVLWCIWVLVAVTALSAASLVVFQSTAEAQSLATNADRPVDATEPTSPPSKANHEVQASPVARSSQAAPGRPTRLLVNPGDSLWSISQGQLPSDATPEQVMNEVEQIFALNRDQIGDDPNLIFAGQELSLPQRDELAAEEPASAQPVVVELPSEPEAAESAAEEPTPAPPPGPEAPPTAQEPAQAVGSFADPSDTTRRGLGLAIIGLSFISGLLGVRLLATERKIASPMRGAIPSERHSEAYALTKSPDRPRDATGSGSVETRRTIIRSVKEDSTNGHQASPHKAAGAKVTSSDFRAPSSSALAFEANVRPGEGQPSSAILLPLPKEEDYYTPPQAAQMLRLSRQRITQMLQSGQLEGKQDPKSRRWRIPQRVVHARLEERPPRKSHSKEEDSLQNEPGVPQQLIRKLDLEVRDLSYRLGRSEVRLEVTEKGERTLRAERDRLVEELERERQRAARLEAELQELRSPWWHKLLGG